MLGLKLNNLDSGRKKKETADWFFNLFFLQNYK